MKIKVILLAVLINIIFVVNASAVELPYTYENLTNDIIELSKLENVEVFSIGQSEYGRELYAVKIGKGELNTIIVGTAHAREWINSVLAIEMAKTYVSTYNNYGYLGGYNVRELLDWCSITFIPMQNPDGVALQQQGLAAFTPEQQEEIKEIGYSGKYKQWKANAKGVDLNKQQNINWYSARMYEPYPSYQNHKGLAPEQAMETRVLLKHIREVKPKALISYHSAGQIVDWEEGNQDIDRDYKLAKRVAAVTKYSIGRANANPIPGPLSPWFRYELGGMALTIEMGRYNGENEVRYDDWPDIWEANKTVGLVVANEVYVNWQSSSEKQAIIDEKSEVKVTADLVGHWSEEMIFKLTSQGVIKGYPDGTFRPDKAVSRAEFAVMLVKGLKLEKDDTYALSFGDKTAIPTWAKGYIATAVKSGIIHGYADGTFKGENNITRAEMVVLMAAAMKAQPPANKRINFVDSKDIPAWALDQVIVALEKGIISGYEDMTFKPARSASRAEACSMLVKMLQTRTE